MIWLRLSEGQGKSTESFSKGLTFYQANQLLLMAASRVSLQKIRQIAGSGRGSTWEVLNGAQAQQQGWRGGSGPLRALQRRGLMTALTWERGIASFRALAGKYLGGVTSDRKETGRSKSPVRVVLALSSRSLGAGVGMDRDSCADTAKCGSGVFNADLNFLLCSW